MLSRIFFLSWWELKNEVRILDLGTFGEYWVCWDLMLSLGLKKDFETLF